MYVSTVQLHSTKISHRGINVDRGMNVVQHSKPRNKCKYLH
jgi:hypothetical protein